MEHPSAAPDLTVVVPVLNEAECVGPLVEELEAALGALARPFEVIFVDDAGTDDTGRVLRDLQGARPWLRVVTHRARYGQSAAMATGFARARGGIVVTMDGDGQNDPADIALLLAALEEDTDAVTGVRARRQDGWVRRVSSRIANAFRNQVTGDRVSDAGCAFRAIRRRALKELPVFNGLHRFLPTILRWQGYRVKEVMVRHRPRRRGRSKYGIGNRLFRGVRDCFAMRWYRARCLPGDRVAYDE